MRLFNIIIWSIILFITIGRWLAGQDVVGMFSYILAILEIILISLTNNFENTK